MINKDLPIINKLGLHARAAASFAKTAGKFAANIDVKFGNNTANGKSVMSLMLLAAVKGTTLNVSVDGEDETEAMVALEQLLANKFGEEE